MDYYSIAQEYLSSAEAARRVELKYKELLKNSTKVNRGRYNAIRCHWGMVRREHIAIANDFLARAEKYQS